MQARDKDSGLPLWTGAAVAVAAVLGLSLRPGRPSFDRRTAALARPLRSCEGCCGSCGQLFGN
jgi:hypothetical protein